MERLTYTWFIVKYVYEGRDHNKYFCCGARRFTNLMDNLVNVCRMDSTIWSISVCKSKKEAIEVASEINEVYRKNGTLATTENLVREG